MSNAFEITTPLPARGSATALRQQLIEKGRQRAAEYTWARAARSLLEVYRNVGAN